MGHNILEKETWSGGSSSKGFNLVLLGKWCWNLLQESDSLWFRVLAAKYEIRDGQLDYGGSITSS
jgi:hypothetical protein